MGRAAHRPDCTDGGADQKPAQTRSEATVEHPAPDTVTPEAAPVASSPRPASPRGRRRARGGALAATVLAGSLAACGVAGPGAGASASASASGSSSAAAAPAVGSTDQPVADNPVGAAAAKALPSVVTISATSGSSAGSGSGSILDAEGHILTNTHVVTLGGTASDASITVRTSDGKVYAAKVVGTDPVSDLAVIKIDAQGLTPITIGSSKDVKVGDDAIAIGAPLGLSNTVTDGIISTLNRTIAIQSSAAPEGQTGSSGTERFRFQLPGEQGQSQQQDIYINVLQTDAAINPGNSGGALVNGAGELVGVNVAIASAGGSSASGAESGNIGVGFAIPVDYAKRVADDLIADGTASHGLLGVTVQPQPAQVQGAAGGSKSTEFSAGALVHTVSSGSPAEKAGLKEGDVITQVGERTVTDTESLTAAVREYRDGETTPVRFTRDGREQTADVTLTAMEASR